MTERIWNNKWATPLVLFLTLLTLSGCGGGTGTEILSGTVTDPQLRIQWDATTRSISEHVNSVKITFPKADLTGFDRVTILNRDPSQTETYVQTFTVSGYAKVAHYKSVTIEGFSQPNATGVLLTRTIQEATLIAIKEGESPDEIYFSSTLEENGVSLSVQPLTIRVGETANLQAALIKDGQSVAISPATLDTIVSNTGIFENARGSITGIEPGTETVTVSSAGLSTTVNVTVIPDETIVTVP